MYVDSILENFELSPFGEFTENADLPEYFDEAADIEEMKAMYLEASAGATKKNIFQKLLELLKKAIKWIWDKIQRFARAIASLFKRKSKTAYQTLEQSGIKPANTGDIQAIAAQVAQDYSKDADDDSAAEPTPVSPDNINNKEGGVIKVPVIIPASDRSTAQPPNGIDAIFSDVMMQLENDNSVTFKFSDVEKAYYRKKAGKVPAKLTSPHGPQVVLQVIQDPSILDDMAEAARILAEEDVNDIITGTRFVDAGRKFLSKVSANPSISDSYTCTLEQITNTSKRLNEISVLLDKVVTAENIFGNALPNVIDTMNGLCGCLAGFQMGMNSLTGVMGAVYQIDGKYIGSVNTMEELDRFVGNAIKNGMPTKYISWNLYMLASKELKGRGKREKPIWGQSRVAFIPTSGDVIHKFALSGWGRQSIKSEAELTKVFTKYGKQNLIAAVLKVYPSGCSCDMEKVDTCKKPNWEQLHKLQEDLNTFLNDHDVKMQINDLAAGELDHLFGVIGNVDNAGLKKTGWCCLDYGMNTRLK